MLVVGGNSNYGQFNGLNYNVCVVDDNTRANNGLDRFHGRPSLAAGCPSGFDGRPSMLDGRPFTTKGHPAVFDGRPATLHGCPAVFDGRPTTVNGRPTKRNGSVRGLTAIRVSPVFHSLWLCIFVRAGYTHWLR